MSTGSHSLRSYARHRREHGLPGRTHQAVRKAIAMERLRDSVTMVKGKARILDFKKADEEWARNTSPLKSPNFGLPEGGESDGGSIDHVDVFDEAGLALIPELTRDRVHIFLSHGTVVFTIGDDPEFKDGLLWRMEPGLACLLGVRLLLRARDAGIDISFLQGKRE